LTDQHLLSDSVYAIKLLVDRVVIDTNVFVSALLSPDGAPRQVLRLALLGQLKPVFSNALFAEYEEVLARDKIFATSVLNERERAALLDAVLSVSDWVRVYFLWRPNLRDEADNHVLELAVAGGAVAIVTGNQRDFLRAELAFPGIKILGPRDYLDWRQQR
jgi:putative PIN family toxin of toxin-antitoxin system